MNFPFDLINNLSFPLISIAHLVFFVVVGLVAIISIILFFHWSKYGMPSKIFALAEVLYLVVSVALVAVAFFSIN